jgi:hypothetical protein
VTEDGEVPGENRRVSTDADTDGTVDDPTDLTFVGPATAEGLDAADAALLAEAGVTSVRTLATCRPAQVADALGVEQSRLETWQERATRRVG